MSRAILIFFMMVLTVTVASGKEARDWREGYVRYGQQLAPQNPSNVPTRGGIGLIVGQLSKANKPTWRYVLDEGPQVFVVESGNALDVDIDKVIKFAPANGYVFLLDRAGKERKLKIVGQMSGAEAEALTKQQVR